MKVLLDNCVPRPLRAHLPGHDVRTAHEMGWANLSNGHLLAVAESRFDVMITADQSLRYQQSLAGRKIALVILPTNRLPAVISLAPRVVAAPSQSVEGDWVEIV